MASNLICDTTTFVCKPGCHTNADCGATMVCNASLHQCTAKTPVFAAISTYVADVSLSAIAIADFNQDSWPDIAVISGSTGGLNVFPNQGQGTFSVATKRYSKPDPLTPAATGMVVVDFDRDGHLDILTSNRTDSTVNAIGAWFQGMAGGAFADGLVEFNGGYGGVAIAAGDFYSDGMVEAVISHLNVMWQGGVGTESTWWSLVGGNHAQKDTMIDTSSQPPSSVAVGDFNEDGHLDIVYSGALVLAAGAGIFQAPVPLSTGVPIVVADLNHDRHLDLASVVGTNVQVLLGMGNGTFPGGSANDTTPFAPGGIAVGDLNGDGNPDIAVAYPSSDIRGFSGVGDGSFEPYLDINVAFPMGGGGAQDIALGDLDGDGQLDIAVTIPGSNSIGVLLNRTN
jgi:hypothetical protein